MAAKKNPEGSISKTQAETLSRSQRRYLFEKGLINGETPPADEESTQSTGGSGTAGKSKTTK